MSESKSTPNKPDFLARLGLGRGAWAKRNLSPAAEIDPSDTYMYGAGITTVSSLLGHGRRAARTRQVIYEKWMRMEGDPLISTAIQLLVTSALGGHETTGDIVFVEEKPSAKENKKLQKIVEEVRKLAPIFNRIAFQMAFTGAIYGDAYARVYSTPKDGVIEVSTSELLRPQLVQPFERGDRTVGYAVTVGKNNFERLDALQMVRLKMPRTVWIPQYGVVEKSLKVVLPEDDYEKLPIMPSMVGGSLIYNAEEPYDNLCATLIGMVGQRWIDSIDESIVTVNMKEMNKEQQARYLSSVKKILERSKEYSEKAVKRGYPILEKIRHILPVNDDKQIINVMPANGGQPGRSGSVTVEDVMFHARLLSGALGVDLSMIGFADQMSGGLGEGGFFRMSAQAAERARVIRVALEECFNQIIDIHTYNKYGVVFTPSERPWDINFYGSISALEAEKQRTKADAMNAAGLIAQTIAALKEIGATKEITERFLQKEMMIDEEDAKLYAEIVEQKAEGEMGMDGGFGGGGMPMHEGGQGFTEEEGGPMPEGEESDTEGEKNNDNPEEKLRKKKAFGKVGGTTQIAGKEV